MNTTVERSDAPVVSAGRRPQLARAFKRAGLLPMMERLRSWIRQDLRILAYHRVLESAEPEDFRFDLDLVSASAEAFREQLAIVKQRFAPIRFEELIDALERDRPLPPRSVLITFDDGYDDNYRIAYPLLREAGLSAMFFVSTGHIDSGRPYAYDWLVHMICVAEAERLRLPELNIDVALPADLGARRRVASDLLDRIKTLSAHTQQDLIARLQREWSLPCSMGHRDCRPMNWEQLREMQRGGMEIGAHGVDHQMLAKLSLRAMRKELVDSKSRIEQELGVQALAMSYPIGGLDAYDDQVIAAAREAGYRVACSYIAGPEVSRPSSRYSMRRLPVEREMDSAWFEAILALPEVFCYRSRSRLG